MDLMNLMNLMKLISVAALALAFTDCGGTGAPPPEPAPKAVASPASNLCNLLTTEEITGVMGASPGEPSPEPDGCSWASSEGADPLVRLSLSPSTLPSYDDFVAEYGREFGGENPSKEYYRPIEGLGNWALYRTTGDVLEVHTGERMLSVTVRPASQELAVSLAEKAVSRLH